MTKLHSPPQTTQTAGQQSRLQVRLERPLQQRMRRIARRKGITLRALMEIFLLDGVKHHDRA